jgi:hypothetical protein
MERQTVTKVPKPATRNHSAQRQSAAPFNSGHRITELQRSIGNQAVQRLINSHHIQAKLNVQRKCTECEEKEAEDPALQRSATDSTPTASAPSSVHDVLRSPGQPLDASTRAFMEPRFGHDFSDVRIHTDKKAADSARSVNARAYTVGRDVVFGDAGYAPGSSEGRKLLAHELTHTIQQGASNSLVGRDAAPAVGVNQPPMIARYAPIRVARVPCSAAATCAAPTGAPGSAAEFGAEQESEEEKARKRRKKMTAARAISTGHSGRARQLEKFLEAEEPGRLANIQGIFIDHDMASGTAAFNQSCAGWIADAMPAGAPTPPDMVGAVKKCVFVPGHLNQEALEFNTTTKATIGGKPRALWRAKALQSLIHETEHSRFNTATAARPLPAGVASPTCTRPVLRKELSEIAAMLSEFPPLSRAAAGEASATGPLHTALKDWFPFVFHPPGESIEGSLSQMGCDCDCAEVAAFVGDTFDEVTTSGSWSAAEKADFNTNARIELPPPGPPKWPL